jgi:hypothetical protein
MTIATMILKTIVVMSAPRIYHAPPLTAMQRHEDTRIPEKFFVSSCLGGPMGNLG